MTNFKGMDNLVGVFGEITFLKQYEYGCVAEYNFDDAGFHLTNYVHFNGLAEIDLNVVSGYWDVNEPQMPIHPLN